MSRTKFAGIVFAVLALLLAAHVSVGFAQTSASQNNNLDGYSFNYTDLLKALRTRVGSDGVTTQGWTSQPFFSVRGRVLLLSLPNVDRQGESTSSVKLEVYQYPTEEERIAESSTISPDGYTINGQTVRWISQPHFWANGRLIVLYVGVDAYTQMLLSGIMGDPLTAHTLTSTGYPRAINAAIEALREQVGGVPIQVKYYEKVAWPDSCLGMPLPGEGCLTVITPGWLVRLHADGVDYEAHTDLFGDQVRFK